MPLPKLLGIYQNPIQNPIPNQKSHHPFPPKKSTHTYKRHAIPTNLLNQQPSKPPTATPTATSTPPVPLSLTAPAPLELVAFVALTVLDAVTAVPLPADTMVVVVDALVSIGVDVSVVGDGEPAAPKQPERGPTRPQPLFLGGNDPSICLSLNSAAIASAGSGAAVGSGFGIALAETSDTPQKTSTFKKCIVNVYADRIPVSKTRKYAKPSDSIRFGDDMFPISKNADWI
ncbi:hypothetical protein Vi05172_g7951 [Venturia inaequalis]|nr:hypothetical protein Vi05172_g7951 [Venturia inaequalis]